MRASEPNDPNETQGKAQLHRAVALVRPPDRTRTVDTCGLSLAILEWGDESAPPLMLAHGGSDFARTFDGFAPLLADAGYRVVTWDHRGHGDSERAALYSWDADVLDALSVLDDLTQQPLPVVGHSKGAGLLSQLCGAFPERFTCFVNIDGVPGKMPRLSEGLSLEDRVAGRARHLGQWLDHRRKSHVAARKPGTIDELAKRRARMNPRLPIEWLRHLVTVGAREDEDGWRWKLDPLIRFGQPGPWRPEWGLNGLHLLRVPMLVLLGAQQEPMGWGTTPDQVREHLPPNARLEVFEDCGHFVHIEQPERTATKLLPFLAEHGSSESATCRPTS